MKRKILKFLFFISVLPSISVAQNTVDNNFNIKAGPGFSRVYLRSSLIPTNTKREDESESSGYGLSTSVGYKWTHFEFMVASDILFGKLEDMTFLVNSKEIRGDGSFRIFSVSPILRYYTPYTIYERWNFFVGAGPTWSLHTFIIANNLNGTDFNNKKRINFENRGASFNIGFEELVPYKEMHPTYIELGYSYMRSKQIFVVDASDFKDARTLSRGNSKDFYGHYVVLRLGITLF